MRHAEEVTSLRNRTYSAGSKFRQDQLQCSKCKFAGPDACWTQKQRENHRRRMTKLVCQACRAQGFHPRNLDAYTCQNCKGNSGSLQFDKVMLNNYRQRQQCRRVRLHCVQCVGQESGKEKTESCRDATAPAPPSDDEGKHLRYERHQNGQMIKHQRQTQALGS